MATRTLVGLAHPAQGRVSRLYFIPVAIGFLGGALSILGLVGLATTGPCGVEKCMPFDWGLTFGLPILLISLVAYLIVLFVVVGRRRNGAAAP